MKRLLLASAVALVCTSAFGADLRLWPGETVDAPFFPVPPPFVVAPSIFFGPLVFPSPFHLLCNQYGCRSSAPRPPIVVTPGPNIALAPIRGGKPLGTQPRFDPPPPQQQPIEPFRAPLRQQINPPPPPQQDAAGREIEDDIMAFCDGHPDEPFCGKLGAYLRAHPRQNSR